jgi:hypothetical protein
MSIDEHLKFICFNKALIDDRLDCVEPYFNELIGSYRLEIGEEIFNPWHVSFHQGIIKMGIFPYTRRYEDFELVPSLLLYLKTLVEVGVDGVNSTKQNFFSRHKSRLLYSSEVSISLDSKRIVLTRRYSRTKNRGVMVRIHIFTLEDLNDRDFMMGMKIPEFDDCLSTLYRSGS